MKNKKMIILVLVLFVLLTSVFIYIKNYDYKSGSINSIYNDNTNDGVNDYFNQDDSASNDVDMKDNLINSDDEKIDNQVDSNKDIPGDNKDNIIDEVISDREEIKSDDIELDIIDRENVFKKITLIDKSNSANCAYAIEYFYEDNEYKYYFNCIKSHNMYVSVNKIEYPLVDALKSGIVTIRELEDNGYKFNKESKNLQIR